MDTVGNSYNNWNKSNNNYTVKMKYEQKSIELGSKYIECLSFHNIAVKHQKRVYRFKFSNFSGFNDWNCFYNSSNKFDKYW